MIEGVIIKPLQQFRDERGWLAELFRTDEGWMPAMAYVSVTQLGQIRGPHEHREQSDYFCFAFGEFELSLWDNRPGSSTYGERVILYVGGDYPRAVLVPPGVVHGYRNVGDSAALVMNFPDRLYKGDGRREEVDEIRHESMSEPAFVL